ncbi:Multidrug+resistance+protein+MdtE [Methylocapsa aurea]|uniref:efflux RND transporter periplasmic adaptor subunit n=1 Tax=Methylocapsa aurea TaxID=663610 RepID=UPI003D187D0C
MPSVALVAPSAGPGLQDVVLPSNVQSFYDARIRSRVQGYIRDWKYDIGAKVKAGDVLATIEAPDLDQQLQQAKGELARAEAVVDLAKLTSKRWSALRSSTAVSQQSADEKSGDYSAKVAAAQAARANVERLKALQSYLQITAPFAGVVTARNVDIGALVGPEMAMELFSVADIHKMRVYVGAPQAYAASIKIGMKAQLKLPQYPDRMFDAVVETTSNAIAEKSRTLLVQLLADNRDGALLPGSYADVHFKLPGRPGVLRIPAAAIFFHGNKLAVATVIGGNKVKIKPIDVARDMGKEIEVAGGLSPDDRLILNPPQTLSDGDEVRIAEPAGSTTKGAE